MAVRPYETSTRLDIPEVIVTDVNYGRVSTSILSVNIYSVLIPRIPTIQLLLEQKSRLFLL